MSKNIPIRDRGQRRLTVARIKAWDGIHPPELADGAGLYLQGASCGESRRWRLRITLNGKRTMRGLGPWTGSLADARRRAEEIRSAAKKGRDIVAEESAALNSDDRETFCDAFEYFWKRKSRNSKMRSTDSNG